MDREKRELREEKRRIKRKGNQRLRRQIRQTLAEQPEEAPYVEPDRGRFTTTDLNGIDRDATRRRTRPEPRSGDGETPD